MALNPEGYVFEGILAHAGKVFQQNTQQSAEVSERGLAGRVAKNQQVVLKRIQVMIPDSIVRVV
jgi:hypothetical protein